MNLIQLKFNIILFLSSFCIILTAGKLNCKMSQVGDDYAGPLSKSASGHKCEYWDRAVKELKIHLKDISFPDGAKHLAKNHCRNPTGVSTGPWCYIRDGELRSSSCNVPFCLKQDCRMSGVGEEYRGVIRKSITGSHCLPWNETKLFDSYDSSALCLTNKRDCSFCRNPQKRKGGPWCYVLQNSVAQAELCSIPFCDNGPVRLFSVNSGNVGAFHKLLNLTSLSIRIRLWDPSDWYDGQVSIILSALDVPIGIKDIGDWGSGLSLSMGNTGSAIRAFEIYDRMLSPGILTTEWTNITLKWGQDLNDSLQLYVYFNGERNPSLMANLDTTTSVLKNFNFSFFSIIGTTGFFQFDSQYDDCLITTTSYNNYTMWLNLEKDAEEINIEIYYRIFRSGIVHFKEFPEMDDIMKIDIFKNGKMIVEDLERRVKFEYVTEPHDFWTWNKVKISTFGSYLHLRNSENNIIVNTTIVEGIKKISWIGMSSEAVAYWALNCNPNDKVEVPSAEPPECVTSKSDYGYNGSQSITHRGEHCIPWIDKRLRTVYSDERFNSFGGKLISNNFCRNLDSDTNGPFCYVRRNQNGMETVIKERCNVRNCSVLDCKHSGIGTDYAGFLSITKSGRECSTDFCKNSDHNLGGAWCYTNQTNVPMDFCQVKDCDRADARMILVSPDDGNYFYVLPHWRKIGLSFWLKNWIPEQEASASFKLIDTPHSYFKININNGGSEKVQLRIVFNNRDELLVEKTMANVIRSGGWTGLWLRCGKGSIELGHENIDLAFLSWNSQPSDVNWQIYPKLLTINTENKKWLGVSFNTKECLVENVSSKKSLKYWPLPLNNEEEIYSQLKLHIQGEGVICINFFIEPESKKYYSLLIEDGKKVSWDYFNNGTKTNIVIFETDHTLINQDSWTELIFRFNEIFLMLRSRNITVFSHDLSKNSAPMLLYWFNVHSIHGKFSWAVDCQPIELSGKPKNGGWGEWSSWICSASCGGGSGRRIRECNNPPPNILGMECSGLAVHEGNCNDFECGDISQDVVKYVKKRLSLNSRRIQVDEGGKELLYCDEETIQMLRQTLTNVKFVWTKNGFFYKESENNTCSFELLDITTKDSGVWICSASWGFEDIDRNLVIEVVSLAVRTEMPTITVREGLDLTLLSNALSLSSVYAGLSLQWYHNEEIWHDYGIVAMQLTTLEKIAQIKKSLAGTWTCIVTQEELGLTWITARELVEVIDPPNFWTHLIEDSATSAIFGGMTEATAQQIFTFSIVFFFVLVLAIALIVYLL